MIYLSTMCKNQGNRLQEWIIYHYKMGIDYFIIFLDNCQDNSKDILENIIKNYNIKIDIYETEKFKPEYQNKHWIIRSHKMYDYVLEKYKNLAEWILFIEVDEFILNYKNNIKFDTFLKNLDTKCLYINSWDFKGPFDENRSILGQSYLCWTDQHRFNIHRYRGKSVIKPIHFNKCIDAHHFQMNNNKVSEEFKKNRDILQVHHGKEVYIDDNIFRIGHFRNHSPPTTLNNFINMEHLIKKDIAIIGGGWYGCYIVEYLLDNYNYLNITLIEKNGDIFMGSSNKNQNRLHLGFHYPRCDITQNKCKLNYEKFVNKYNDLVDNIDKNYYIISDKSNVKYNDYIKKYDNYQLIDNAIFTNIDGKIINTTEKYINFNKAKKYFKNRFQNRVKFIFNYEVISIENKENNIIINNDFIFHKIFNCTYNQIQIEKDVIYEKCLTLLYKKIDITPFDCLTIMDGNFASIFNYNDNIYTLTDVKYTPLIKGKFNEIETYNNYNLDEKIELFEKNVSLYYPEFKNKFKYYDYYESYKCKNISENDSRDINITIDNNIFNVWCGKISLIFEMNNQINIFI
jgi:hypothetical protein